MVVMVVMGDGCGCCDGYDDSYDDGGDGGDGDGDGDGGVQVKKGW